MAVRYMQGFNSFSRSNDTYEKHMILRYVNVYSLRTINHCCLFSKIFLTLKKVVQYTDPKQLFSSSEIDKGGMYIFISCLIYLFLTPALQFTVYVCTQTVQPAVQNNGIDGINGIDYNIEHQQIFDFSFRESDDHVCRVFFCIALS